MMIRMIRIPMVSIGTIIGAIAGYFGGKIEMVLMRLADIMLSFPGVVLAIAIAGILGGSLINTILALSVVGWAKYARLVRSMTLKVRGEEYVTAAVMMGASTWTILRRHIIPNILPLVVTTGALDIGAILEFDAADETHIARNFYRCDSCLAADYGRVTFVAGVIRPADAYDFDILSVVFYR